MRGFAYYAMIGFLGVTLALLLGNVTPVEAVAALLALAAHLPAAMTVKVQRAVLDPAPVPYPEAPVPILVLAVWVLIGWLEGQLWNGSSTGFAIALALGVCYAAVRVVTFATSNAGRFSGHVPNFFHAALAKTGNRTIYALRVALAVLSLAMVLRFLMGDGPGITWVLALLTACTAVVTAVVTWKNTEELCRHAARTARASLRGALVQHPVTTAIYYSNASVSKHTAPTALIRRLSDEGLPTAVITRDSDVCSVLGNSGARHVWFAPTIDTLDAVAQDGIETVFYVNDAVKNGHFIRYNQYLHVLVATGDIAESDMPLRNLAMYSAVVAPDEGKAIRWRAGLPSDLAARIMTVASPGESSYLPAPSHLPVRPALALFVGPDPMTGRTPAHLATAVPALIAAVGDNDQLNLTLVFPKEADGLSYALRDEAAVVAEAGTLRCRQGTAVFTANIADIVAVATPAELPQLYATGKPLIWLGEDSSPSGLYPFCHAGFTKTLTNIIGTDPLSCVRKEAGQRATTHFPNLSALIVELKSRRSKAQA